MKRTRQNIAPNPGTQESEAATSFQGNTFNQQTVAVATPNPQPTTVPSPINPQTLNMQQAIAVQNHTNPNDSAPLFWQQIDEPRNDPGMQATMTTATTTHTPTFSDAANSSSADDFTLSTTNSFSASSTHTHVIVTSNTNIENKAIDHSSATIKAILGIPDNQAIQVNQANQYGLTPLMQVIRSRNLSIELIQHMLQLDANLDAKDSKGQTALMHLIHQLRDELIDSNMCISIMQLLLENGATASINTQRHDGWTILNILLEASNTQYNDELYQMVLLLLQHGAHVNNDHIAQVLGIMEEFLLESTQEEFPLVTEEGEAIDTSVARLSMNSSIKIVALLCIFSSQNDVEEIQQNNQLAALINKLSEHLPNFLNRLQQSITQIRNELMQPLTRNRATNAFMALIKRESEL